jgi:glycerate kinase
MRVLIAPDSFGGTLSAADAAEAIAAGWRASAPDTELLLRPLADGGTGFLDVLATVLPGDVHRLSVAGPAGEPVSARWLAVGDTAYIEMAEAAGLHLVAPADRPALAEHATTCGVGELLAAARDAGMSTAVLGLGGSATNDGGAGLLAALGAVPMASDGSPVPPGGTALASCARLSGTPAVGSLKLVAAADVENPLLGEHGAIRTFGPQKGATGEAVERLESAMTHWADVLATLGRDVRDEPGAGAAGGLGAALLALGAERVSGAGLVRELTGLDQAVATADLVITGEGSFDWQSLRGKLVTSVAEAAAARGVPVLVLAGQVAVGRRQAASVGVAAMYSVTEHAGSVEASMADPAGTLSALAEDVAGEWSRR